MKKQLLASSLAMAALFGVTSAALAGTVNSDVNATVGLSANVAPYVRFTNNPSAFNFSNLHFENGTTTYIQTATGGTVATNNTNATVTVASMNDHVGQVEPNDMNFTHNSNPDLPAGLNIKIGLKAGAPQSGSSLYAIGTTNTQPWNVGGLPALSTTVGGDNPFTVYAEIDGSPSVAAGSIPAQTIVLTASSTY